MNSVRLGVKLKSRRKWNCRHISPNIKKPALLQDKLFYSKYSRVLDDHFAVLKMAVTELLRILTQIRVW